MPEVQLTWLGHGTFRFDSPGGKRIYVDPWLTNPKCPEGEKEPERIDAIAITQRHGRKLHNPRRQCNCQDPGYPSAT